MATHRHNSGKMNISKCWLKTKVEHETPREMIKREILANLQSANDFRKIHQTLLDLTKVGLKSNGTLKNNVRNKRNEILGVEYKSIKGSETKL